MIVRPPSSIEGLQSIVTVSVEPSYEVIGAAGVEGIVAATIENSADDIPVPIEVLADTLNL
jgi:hypothetical protein